MKSIVVYGSYGYTGNLIVEECRKRKLSVILSGRDQHKLEQQSRTTGYPFEVAAIDDRDSLAELLAKADLVIHCAGPFVHTSRQMIDICLQTSTHYVDITGEFGVFQMLMKFDEQARAAGIMMLPGAGFDVVPSDCLSMHLKNKLPDATHLRLAFRSGGGLSRGTLNTMITSLGYGGAVREEGKVKPIPLGSRTAEIDFGSFRSMTMCIPWGDISTAYRSTGIPNIEVYTAVKPSLLRWARISRYFNWLLRMKWLKNVVLRRYKNFTGPSEDRRHRSKSILWGEVTNGKGEKITARMEVASGYTLTAHSSVLIAEKILGGNFKAGYQTPSTAYGEGLIMELEGSSWIK